MAADLQGKVIKTQEVRAHSLEEINAALSSFKGETKQIPPMYSALKKDGVRLYKLAREGKEVERKPRTINISEIKLLGETILEAFDTVANTPLSINKQELTSRLNTDPAYSIGEEKVLP